MKMNLTAFAAAFTLLTGMASAANKIDIGTWTLDQAGRDGWSVKKLIGTQAFGPNRKEIGKVENVIFGPSGDVRQLIIATGDFLGFDETPLAVGDKHIFVMGAVEDNDAPWDLRFGCNLRSSGAILL